MDSKRITPPPDPSAFLPVRALLLVSIEVGFGGGGDPRSMLRGSRSPHGHRISNGMQQFMVRRPAGDWGSRSGVWVARVDDFCAFLSHRRVVTGGWKKDGTRIQPMDPVRRRRVLNPGWVRAEAWKHLNFKTRKIAECLRDGKELEWKRPII